MRRSVLLAVVCVAALAGGSAQANHKKPITGAYRAVVPVTSTCMAGVPGSEDLHAVTLPEAGRMVVDLAGTGVDLDMYLLNPTGGAVASSAGSSAVEKITYKVKKPGKYTIRVCNWAAGPIGDVKFVFTFN